MKKIPYNSLLIISFLLFLASCKLAQKTTPLVHTECDSLYFDLDTGMINAISPMLPQADIKEWFTCYTGSTPEGTSKDCGGGVFYNTHGFAYYTYFNYIEVNKNFKGTLSKPLIGLERKQARSYFPGFEKTEYQEKEFPNFDFFAAPYGCLRVEYANDTVLKVSAHFTLCENVDVCR